MTKTAGGARPGPGVLERAAREGRTVLTEPEAAEILAAYRVPQPREALAGTREEARDAARQIGYPVVLKLVSPDVLHKTEVGGVRTGLADAAEVEAAFDHLRRVADTREARWGGVLVQEQVDADHELIVGARWDPTFGPAVLVGLGGTLAEVLGDTAVRVAPVTLPEARGMLAELRGHRLLAGYRGRPGADLEALAGLIVTTSRLACELPLEALDLNPVLARAGGAGVVAVDRRLILRPAPAAPARVVPGGARDAVRRLLAPSGVAVVGASPDATKIGSRVLHFLVQHRFPGKLYAVNPRGESGLAAVPTVRSIPELPRDLELACIAVPPAACEAALRACGEQGIRHAIVFTSGFAEVDAVDAETRLVDAARDAGVRFCGPNSLGVLNAHARLFASFSGSLVMSPPPGGEIAYLSQSGALGGAFISRLWERGIPVCRFVSVGNQADLELADYVDAMAHDPDVRVIALFVEGVRDGRRLVGALREAGAQGKPVVAYKAGRSREGQAAIRSHTGALAGDDTVWTAALRQAGAIRVADMHGLFDAAIALAWQGPPRGPRVGIVSTSGGACGILADECRARGFEVPELGEATHKRVAAEIPSFGASRNPIDVTAQLLTRPDMLGNVLEILAEDPEIDAILVMLTTLIDPLAEGVATRIAATAGRGTKPVLVSWLVAPSLAARGMRHLIDAKVPIYDTPERAVVALDALAEWHRRRQER